MTKRFIAEAYVVNEALTFCPMYIRNAEAQLNRMERHMGEDDDDVNEGKLLLVFK